VDEEAIRRYQASLAQGAMATPFVAPVPAAVGAGGDRNQMA
jgi:hypothetical protein